MEKFQNIAVFIIVLRNGNADAVLHLRRNSTFSKP